MKKSAVFLVIMLSVFTACGKRDGIERVTTAAIENDTPAAAELVDKEALYVSREAILDMQLYKVTEEYIYLSYSDNNLTNFMAKARKNSTGKYEFSFSVIRERDYDIGVQKENGEIEVTFEILDEKLNLQVKGSSDTSIFIGQTTLKKKKVENDIVCDFSKCLGNFEKVYKSIYEKDLELLEVGKERDGNKVSYLDVSIGKTSYLDNTTEIGYYQIGDISFCSTKEECDKTFGNPIQVTATDRVYRYKNDYVIHLVFEGEQMVRMGIYLGSREEAMKEYMDGKFTMRGCRIVDATAYYEKGGVVTLPKDAQVIGPRAFWAKGHTKKIQLQIPKDVYIEREAFYGCGSADITFEEGREVIGPRAFQEVACYNSEVKITITLPDSIRELKERAFWHDFFAESLTLHLPEGLEVVGDGALQNTYCDLPSTIRVLGNGALKYWQSVGDFKLPEKLEEIGDFCMEFEASFAEKLKTIKIPASVKKIGLQPINYEYTGPGVSVNSKNRHFKSNKQGWLFSKDGKELYFVGDYDKDVIIPKSVEYICCRIDTDPYGEGSDSEIILPKSLKKNLFVEYCEENYW